MPLTWVLLRAPAGQAPVQNVFVNNDFRHPVGMTGTPFQVEAGLHTFSLHAGGRVIAEAMEECGEASESVPFRIDLIATASALLDPPAPPRVPPTPPRARKTAKKSRKKAARKKAAGKKAAPKRKAAPQRKAAPKRKTAAKRKPAPKRKTAKRKAAPKRKATAKKTAAGRKKPGRKSATRTMTKTKRPARGRSR